MKPKENVSKKEFYAKCGFEVLERKDGIRLRKRGGCLITWFLISVGGVLALTMEWVVGDTGGFSAAEVEWFHIASALTIMITFVLAVKSERRTSQNSITVRATGVRIYTPEKNEFITTDHIDRVVADGLRINLITLPKAETKKPAHIQLMSLKVSNPKNTKDFNREDHEKAAKQVAGSFNAMLGKG